MIPSTSSRKSGSEWHVDQILARTDDQFYQSHFYEFSPRSFETLENNIPRNSPVRHHGRNQKVSQAFYITRVLRDPPLLVTVSVNDNIVAQSVPCSITKLMHEGTNMFLKMHTENG